jgi:hypothetical protein
VEVGDVAEALRVELASRFELVDAELDAETLALAQRLEPAHRSPV